MPIFTAGRTRLRRGFDRIRAKRSTAAIGLAALLCSALGLSTGIDTMLFSALVRIPPAAGTPERVAIVDMGAGSQVDEAALRARLQSLGARAVVAAPSPGMAACAPVVYGGLTVRYPADAALRCARIGEASTDGWPVGVSLAPDFGIATSLAIPHLAAVHVLAAEADDAIVAGAIEGRTVLLERGWSRPAYVTPLQRVDGPVNGATFDALMVESLLSGRAVRWSGLGIEALWLIALLLSWALWNRHDRSLRATWLSCGALALLSLLAAFAWLRWGRVFVPQTAALGALAAAGLWQRLDQRRRVGRLLRRLQTRLAQATQRAGQDTWRADPPTEAREWARLAELALQHFDARRCWMLRLPAAASLLECAATAPSGTPLDPGIGRDRREPPYSTAETSGRSVELDAALLPLPEPGLAGAHGENRRALVAPILRSGEVFGFLLLELDADTVLTSPRLFEEAADYADAAAKRLQLARHAPAADEYPVPAAPALHTLAADAVLQLDILRDLMSASPQPGATLGLDGRVLFSNRAFSDFALASEIPLLSIRLQEMLGMLCGLSTTDAAQEVRRLLLYGALLERPLSADRMPSATTLRAYAVGRGGQRPRGRADIQDALVAHCVVLELVPSAAADVRLIALCDAAERLVADARLELEALRTLLARARSEPGGLTRVQAGIQRLHVTVDGFARHVRLERMHDGRILGVCDLYLLLQDASHAMSPRMQERGLILQIEGDAELPAAVSPELARSMIEAALVLLVQDAANDSTILCVSRGDADGSGLTMRNRGFGVPDWHLRDLRASAGRTGPSEDALERLLALTEPLREVGVELTVDCTLGEGFALALRAPVPD